MNFQRILSPGKIGPLSLKNRMIVPAMLTGYAGADGSLTERLIRYYEERAFGGFAMIVTEDTAVSPQGKGAENLTGLWREEQIARHQTLTSRIHRADAKILIQLYHAGRQAPGRVCGQCVAPSPIPDPLIQEMPHELSSPEIREIEAQFVEAARRAEKAGYDGAELHAAHGYLIHEFLSPFSNKRTDEYGGCLKNRMRLLLRIIHGIRAVTSPNFVLTCKLSAEEFTEGGSSLEETKLIAAILEENRIDAITVSGGNYRTNQFISAPYYCHGTFFAEQAYQIRKCVSIPVIAINRISTPAEAEGVLKFHCADFCAIGRASIADPHFAEKIKDNRIMEILPCIACNQGCIGRVAEGKDISCLVNPMTGREASSNLNRVAHPEEILIAGGGPAGLEAAWILAKRGHHVELFEQEKRLGGTWLQAAVPPCKTLLNHHTAWLIRQVENSSCKIHLKTTLTPEILKQHPGGLLLCAAGAESRYPDTEGLETHPDVVSAIDILKGKTAPARSVLIIGGGMVGMECAEHLAMHNIRVSVAARNKVAKNIVSSVRWFLMKNLIKYGVTLYEDTDILKVEEENIFLCSANGEVSVITAEQIILAAGGISRTELAQWAKENSYPFFVIGDARKPGDALQAILEGFLAARSMDDRKILRKVQREDAITSSSTRYS